MSGCLKLEQFWLQPKVGRKLSLFSPNTFVMYTWNILQASPRNLTFSNDSMFLAQGMGAWERCRPGATLGSHSTAPKRGLLPPQGQARGQRVPAVPDYCWELPARRSYKTSPVLHVWTKAPKWSKFPMGTWIMLADMDFLFFKTGTLQGEKEHLLNTRKLFHTQNVKPIQNRPIKTHRGGKNYI